MTCSPTTSDLCKPEFARQGREATAGGQALTCRGSFRVDQDGGLVADSFSYAPLVDFTRYLRHHVSRSVPMKQVVSDALTWINQREATFHESWEQIAGSGVVATRRSCACSRGFGCRAIAPAMSPNGYGRTTSPRVSCPPGYRGDLLAAVTAPTSALLRDFMAGRPGGRPAVFEDVESRQALEPLLDPGLAPRAAWPSGYRLRLSQQVALTAILDPTAARLSALNGPPGTGKTALLRDLYANLITRRAAVMSTFRTPSSAFRPAGLAIDEQSAVAALCTRSRALWFRNARRFEQ